MLLHILWKFAWILTTILINHRTGGKRSFWIKYHVISWLCMVCCNCIKWQTRHQSHLQWIQWVRGVDNKVSKVPPDTLIACDVDYCNLDEDVKTVGVKITMMRIRNMVMYMKKCWHCVGSPLMMILFKGWGSIPVTQSPCRDSSWRRATKKRLPPLTPSSSCR